MRMKACKGEDAGGANIRYKLIREITFIREWHMKSSNYHEKTNQINGQSLCVQNYHENAYETGSMFFVIEKGFNASIIGISHDDVEKLIIELQAMLEASKRIQTFNVAELERMTLEITEEQYKQASAPLVREDMSGIGAISSQRGD